MCAMCCFNQKFAILFVSSPHKTPLGNCRHSPARFSLRSRARTILRASLLIETREDISAADIEGSRRSRGEENGIVAVNVNAMPPCATATLRAESRRASGGDVAAQRSGYTRAAKAETRGSHISCASDGPQKELSARKSDRAIEQDTRKGRGEDSCSSGEVVARRLLVR